MVCNDRGLGSCSVGPEVLQDPYDAKPLTFSAGIVNLGGVEGTACTGDNVFLVIPHLGEYCTYGMKGEVCIEAEGECVFGKSDDRGGGEVVFEGGEGLLTFCTPMEGCVLLGELVERVCQLGEVFDKPPIEGGKSNKCPDFSDV